jgi:phosphatidate cytidylyltransferase
MRRTLSAVVLGAFTVGAMLLSPWTFLVLVVLASAVVAWEWARLTRGRGVDATAVICAAGAAAIAIFILIGRAELALAVFAAALVAIAAINRKDAPWALTGLAYAALPAAALVWLRGDQAFGTMAVLYLLAVAWTTDTASYAAGRLIGGPKLAPKISPQKTWSGFIVGTLTPALVGMAFALALEGTSPWRLALVSVALALACQMGDLFESRVKRRFGAKDMSQLIPGHGGLLDRIDGLLFAAVLAGLIALRDPAHPGQALLIW